MYLVGDRVLTNHAVDGTPRKGTVSHVGRSGNLFVSLDYLEAYGGNTDLAFEESEVSPLLNEVNYG
jgi:hypothetical protein